MEQIYRLQERRGTSYQDFEEGYLEVNAVPLELTEELAEISLSLHVRKIAVPVSVKKLIDDFCTSYPQVDNLKLLTLIASSQNLYRNYCKMDSQDSLVNQFEYLQRDLSYLLNLHLFICFCCHCRKELPYQLQV